MKKFLLIPFLAALLALSAQAAVVVGFEAGYLTDWKEAYYSARVGDSLKTDDTLSHQVELELGYTQKSDSVAVSGGVVTAKGKIASLMLNYRLEITGSDKLGYYVGVGLGTARIQVSGAGLGVSVSDSGNAMGYQGFAGLTYKATDTTSLHLGLKYLWIGDVTILGMKSEVGNDLGISAGISFRF